MNLENISELAPIHHPHAQREHFVEHVETHKNEIHLRLAWFELEIKTQWPSQVIYLRSRSPSPKKPKPAAEETRVGPTSVL